MNVGRYFLHVAVTMSQAGNAIFLAGHPDETISARCYKNRYCAGWEIGYRMINRLYFWQENHCRNSWLYDVQRAEEVSSYADLYLEEWEE